MSKFRNWPSWRRYSLYYVLDWVVKRLYGYGDDRGRERSRSRSGLDVEMVVAIEARDYVAFRELYLVENPRDSDARVVEEYEWRVECSEDI